MARADDFWLPGRVVGTSAGSRTMWPSGSAEPALTNFAKAVSSESGGIIRTVRSARNWGGKSLDIEEVAYNEGAAPTYRRWFRLGATGIGFMQASIQELDG
jgi:hypothetical protein